MLHEFEADEEEYNEILKEEKALKPVKPFSTFVDQYAVPEQPPVAQFRDRMVITLEPINYLEIDPLLAGANHNLSVMFDRLQGYVLLPDENQRQQTVLSINADTTAQNLFTQNISNSSDTYRFFITKLFNLYKETLKEY